MALQVHKEPKGSFGTKLNTVMRNLRKQYSKSQTKLTRVSRLMYDLYIVMNSTQDGTKSESLYKPIQSNFGNCATETENNVSKSIGKYIFRNFKFIHNVILNLISAYLTTFIYFKNPDLGPPK